MVFDWLSIKTRYMKPQFTIFSLNPENFIKFGFFNQTLGGSSTYILIVYISSLTKWIILQTLDFCVSWWHFPCDCVFWWRERDGSLSNPLLQLSNRHVYLPSLILGFFCRRWNILICRSFSDCELKPKDGHSSHFLRAFSSRVDWPSSENFLQVLETSYINVL